MKPLETRSEISPRSPNPEPRSLLFIAGDVSGDIHSARLAREVLSRHPDWTIDALGGLHLQAAGANIIGDTSGCGVIGLVSALALLPRVLKLRAKVLSFLQTQSIDAVVLCDWGAFNARLLPELQKRGIPVLYYFPPRSWQKHSNGGLGIAPFVSRVATPFEWSAQRLREAGCNAEWVGHPLLEIVQPSKPIAELRAEFGVQSPDEKLIALLPGSRDLELKYIAPHLNEVACGFAEGRDPERWDDRTHLLLSNPGHDVRSRVEPRPYRFVAAVPSGTTKRARKYFDSEISIVENRAADLLLACDAAIVKSGTATLEAAVANAPQVVVYDGPAVLKWQWKLTGMSKRVPFVAMPNIILGRKCVPELLGDVCRAPHIAVALEWLLEDEAVQECGWGVDEVREQMREGYTLVRRALGSELLQTATQRTATILEEMLRDRAA